MGYFLSKIFSKYKDKRIIMVGLDSAGKTTLMMKLKSFLPEREPTIGYAVECLEYKGLSIISWDLCVVDKVRVLWKYYYKNTNGIVFVVDSSDKSRLENAKEELNKMLAEEELNNQPLLVMANKQDIKESLSCNDIVDLLGLKDIKNRQWLVQGTSGVTGNGLTEGLDWMFKTLNK